MVLHYNSCRFGCKHEQHQVYRDMFKQSAFERQFLWDVALYVTDPKISFSNADDVELFQDLVFDSPYGRIHIFFYEELFKNYYQYQPEWTLKVFPRYLQFLEKISSLFVDDAFHYIYKQKDSKLIEKLLKTMPLNIKLRFIKFSEKYPEAIQTIPKLKIYNLFS